MNLLEHELLKRRILQEMKVRASDFTGGLSGKQKALIAGGTALGGLTGAALVHALRKRKKKTRESVEMREAATASATLAARRLAKAKEIAKLTAALGGGVVLGRALKKRRGTGLPAVAAAGLSR